MNRKYIVLLGVFMALTGFAENDVAAAFRNATNLWVKGELQGFLDAIPKDKESRDELHRDVSDKEIIRWYLDFLAMGSPTNCKGVAAWQMRSPGCDWMRVRAEIAERVGCKLMVTDVDFQRAVAREYRRVKLARPVEPVCPFPQKVLPNGIIEGTYSSFEEMEKYSNECIFTRDLQLAWDHYLAALAWKFTYPPRRNHTVSKERRKEIIAELMDIAGFSDKERKRWTFNL